MKITLLVVGKTNDPHFIAGIEEYAKRIRHYLPSTSKSYRNCGTPKAFGRTTKGERSGFAVESVPTGRPYRLVGRTRTGTSFGGVRRMDGKRMAAGLKRMVFVVGGPYGSRRASTKGKRESLAFAHDILASMIRLFSPTNLSGHDHHQRRTLSS